MTETEKRDRAISYHSDVHKDLYHMRPRRNWAGVSTNVIVAEIRALQSELNCQFAEEAERRHRAATERPPTFGLGWKVVGA